MAAERRRVDALRVGIIAWATIGVALIVGAAFWFLGRISGALTPFVMAGILVLMLRGPVARLERRGMKRWLAVTVAYVGLLIIVGLLGAIVIPLLAKQVSEFFKAFPNYYDTAQNVWETMLDRFHGVALPGWVNTSLANTLDVLSKQLASWGSRIAQSLLSTGSAAAGMLANSILALVIAFWILKDMSTMRREVLDIVGHERREEAEVIINTVLHSIGGYIRGQVIVSAVTGTLAALFLALLGIPYAIVLGLITGLLNVVPYVGPFIGGLAAAIVGAFVGPWYALGALGLVIVAQQVTDLFVTPRVMSEQVDLHPVLVILSLLVGASLFGFLGMIFAIPVAAALKGIFVYYFEKHTQRELATENGALFRSKSCDDDDEDEICDDEPILPEQNGDADEGDGEEG